MPQRSILHCFALLFTGLSCYASCVWSSEDLQHDILRHVLSGGVTQRYTACTLLAELPLPDSILEAIESRIAEESDIANRLCLRYALARRTQEIKYDEAFVAEYPSDETIRKLWQRQENAGYPLGVAPAPELYLAELANQSDEAMLKLVTSLRYADGAHSESLIDLVAKLYRTNPTSMEGAAHSAGVDIREIKQPLPIGGDNE